MKRFLNYVLLLLWFHIFGVGLYCVTVVDSVFKNNFFSKIKSTRSNLIVNKQYWAAILGSRWGQKLALWILQMHWKSIIYTGATNTTIKKMRYLIYPLKVAINRVTEPKQLINIIQQIFRQRKKIVVYDTCICLQY